jgi:transcriptional regulator with XRE-family HTH domain
MWVYIMKIDSEKLRNLRISKKITQVELAAVAGVTQGMISQIEQGTRNVNMDTMENIAKLLGCTVEELSENGAPTPFVALVRNCKGLTETQIEVVNNVVLALTKLNAASQKYVEDRKLLQGVER